MLEYNGWNPQKLKEFEIDIAKIYERGEIHAPIHLSDGSENKLISVFNKYKITINDWIFSTWRSHYHWLLSGRNPEELKKQILDGNSMHIFGNKFFTSSIVGGICPIALGVAKGLAMKGSKERVFCFVGCMAATSGLFSECLRYAIGWNLPILYVIEDNNLSVTTCTKEVWGTRNGKNKVMRYHYKRLRPHAGVGKFVLF